MQKTVTVYVVIANNINKVYLSKGEAMKAQTVLTAFGIDSTLETDKRTATIA